MAAVPAIDRPFPAQRDDESRIRSSACRRQTDCRSCSPCCAFLGQHGNEVDMKTAHNRGTMHSCRERKIGVTWRTLSMIDGKKIVVVMPAYNAAQTLERTVSEVPALVDDIILVDDRSKDNT